MKLKKHIFQIDEDRFAIDFMPKKVAIVEVIIEKASQIIIENTSICSGS